MKRLMKFRAFDIPLNRFLTQDETDHYPLAALKISTTVIFDEYTGFCDGNRKEIYENDLLEAEDGARYRVIFSEGTFAAHAAGAWRPLRMFSGHNAFYANIIGNTHENPNMTIARIRK